VRLAAIVLALLGLGLLASSATAKRRARRAAADEAPSAEAALQRGCRSRPGYGLLLSPLSPTSKEPLRVIVVAERRPAAGVTLAGVGPDGARHALTAQRGGGPPWWWVAQLDAPAVGMHRFALVGEDGAALACGKRRVEARRPEPAAAGPEQWAVRQSWTRYTENLYSAWIEKLVDVPVGQAASWTPLHQVIRDPKRNILYNHLGADEDGPSAARAVVVQPDCADMPYFLRGYFSWKLGLAFGWRHCDRGSSTRPTRCGALKSNLSVTSEPARRGGVAARFSRFLRQHVGLVHSGSGRTAPDDDETDLYPVALSRAALRPGTVYVDPYGHLLVLAKWIDQDATRGGLLYAVDGHPDLSVGRKRFWRGAFMFSDQIQGGAGGFKAYRPLVKRGGQIEALTNAEIRASRDYGNISDEQYKLGLEGFYERMDQIITPRPLPPAQAYRERLEALLELITERIGSVQVGDDYHRKSRGVIPMPKGPKIFEYKGAWEDYSTPARDMRLLIAIEEVRQFPTKGRFALGADQARAAARQEMERLFERFTKEKTFTYKRSDGKPWTLTMATLIARRKHLEVAYNPNDCNEVRWGAEGEELKTCERRAPEAQRRLMERYRTWFASRTRPPLR
jgi:hypothetical protein